VYIYWEDGVVFAWPQGQICILQQGDLFYIPILFVYDSQHEANKWRSKTTLGVDQSRA
jgi:hypothetical protein